MTNTMENANTKGLQLTQGEWRQYYTLKNLAEKQLAAASFFARHKKVTATLISLLIAVQLAACSDDVKEFDNGGCHEDPYALIDSVETGAKISSNITDFRRCDINQDAVNSLMTLEGRDVTNGRILAYTDLSNIPVDNVTILSNVSFDESNIKISGDQLELMNNQSNLVEISGYYTSAICRNSVDPVELKLTVPYYNMYADDAFQIQNLTLDGNGEDRYYGDIAEWIGYTPANSVPISNMDAMVFKRKGDLTGIDNSDVFERLDNTDADNPVTEINMDDPTYFSFEELYDIAINAEKKGFTTLGDNIRLSGDSDEITYEDYQKITSIISLDGDLSNITITDVKGTFTEAEINAIGAKKIVGRVGAFYTSGVFHKSTLDRTIIENAISDGTVEFHGDNATDELDVVKDINPALEKLGGAIIIGNMTPVGNIAKISPSVVGVTLNSTFPLTLGGGKLYADFEENDISSAEAAACFNIFSVDGLANGVHKGDFNVMASGKKLDNIKVIGNFIGDWLDGEIKNSSVSGSINGNLQGTRIIGNFTVGDNIVGTLQNTQIDKLNVGGNISASSSLVDSRINHLKVNGKIQCLMTGATAKDSQSTVIVDGNIRDLSGASLKYVEVGGSITDANGLNGVKIVDLVVKGGASGTANNSTIGKAHFHGNCPSSFVNSTVDYLKPYSPVSYPINISGAQIKGGDLTKMDSSVYRIHASETNNGTLGSTTSPMKVYDSQHLILSDKDNINYRGQTVPLAYNKSFDGGFDIMNWDGSFEELKRFNSIGVMFSNQNVREA
jgi:hypothetical protein